MKKLKLYFYYFKNLFSKKRKREEAQILDIEQIKEEIWEADFSNKEKSRFIEEKGDGYESFFENINEKTCFCLKLNRKHLYAWTINPVFRYNNFVLDAEIELPNINNFKIENNNGSAGSYACGFIFKHISDKAFYALLISNKGWVRIDAVVNSNPMPILGWTKPLTAIENTVFKIKLICAGTYITVLINNTWLGKFECDIVQAAGKIGFAAQNWDNVSYAKFILKKYKIISQPLLVENADTSANILEAIPPESYINLASTYYAMGQYISAIYQIKHAWKIREPNLHEYILAARIYFAQGLLEEAEQAYCNAIDMEFDNDVAITELASLYYRINKFSELEKLLINIPENKIDKSPLLCSLKAHLLSNKSKHEEAACYYEKAFKLNPNEGIFKYNYAKELYRAKKAKEALKAYIEAGNIFLSSESYTEMADVIHDIEKKYPNDNAAQILCAKFYYGVGNYEKSAFYLKTLCDEKTTDSTVWYLYGLILYKEDIEKSINYFKKACKIEPEYGLYHFRLAEALYLSGKDCKTELCLAEKFDTENGWVFNLKALCAIDDNDLFCAENAINKARTLLPDEIIVLENYVEVMRLKGQLHLCSPLFDSENNEFDLAAEKNRAKAFHIYANALFYDGQYDEADNFYQKALHLNPNDSILLTDKAENAIKMEYLNEADSLLVKAMDIEISERIYRLIALVALKKGDYIRAEVTLQEAFKKYNTSDNILFDLAYLYINTNHKDSAKKIIDKLSNCKDKDKLETLIKYL